MTVFLTTSGRPVEKGARRDLGVFARCTAVPALERLDEVRHAAVSDGTGDGGDTECAFIEHLPRPVESGVFDVLVRWPAGCLAEGPRECRRTHVCVRGQRRDRQRLGEMVRNMV